MRAVVLLLASLAAFTSAQANIGEKQSEVEARLGTGTPGPDGTLVYRKSGFTVEVLYQDGVSVAERIKHATDNEPLTESERATLLRVNGAGQVWTKTDDGKSLLRADGKTGAAIDNPSTLFFMDLAFAVAKDRQIEAAQKQKEAQQKQDEANRLADAFGPLPPAAPVLPASTPTPMPTIRPFTPLPPYPFQASQMHVSGSGLFRVTFDASGHVASVTAVQSTGNGLLDINTIDWARKNWTGQPGGSVMVPVDYVLK